MLQIQEFEREVKRGLSKFLYFCYAVEPFFLLEATKILKAEISSMSIESYETSEFEQFDFKSILNITSLFSE
ncbi:MAG: hypothetical protein ABDH16_01155, partial [Thermodesulfovibrionaceae bacterium]